jgi:hypothetical protein
MDTSTIDDLAAQESMFVQTAQGITSAAATITLAGVTSSTLYFSDRPPPNAVLSFLPAGGTAPEDVVVVITDPLTLFIDPFGRPLSPVSVCGVRRRGRRRARRRF